MANELPSGVKYARTANFISIILFVIIALCLAGIAIPNFIKGAQDAGATEVNPILLVIVGLIAFSICLTPAILLIILNRGLLQLKERARIYQIILSCLFLLGFPLGTILYGISLYFMLFDPIP